MSKKKSGEAPWPPPIEYPVMEVVRVTEGRKTWYEVKGGMSIIRDGWFDGRYPTEKMARRVADKFNGRLDRVEESLG